jgi:hypothetical protein
MQEGEKWQGRRPRWLAVTRVGADSLQRIAHCIYMPKPCEDVCAMHAQMTFTLCRRVRSGSAGGRAGWL